jgi:hypothetical protein
MHFIYNPVEIDPNLHLWNGEVDLETRPLDAKFTSFELPSTIEPRDATVAIPASHGMQHIYFFINLKTGKGLTVKYPKRGGLTTKDSLAFLHRLCTFAIRKEDRFFPRIRTLFRRYHNGVSFWELLFRVPKPHGITHIGDQRFLVSLWSSSAYFVIDLNKKTVELQMLNKERKELFSAYQYFDKTEKETYFATHAADDEHHKHVAEDFNSVVPVKIRKYNWNTKKINEVWNGGFGTDTHCIALNKDKSYLGLVQFGDFFDEENNLVPSKILILDLRANKEWWIDNTGWSPSAHIDWDPVEPDICYLSCHKGVIAPVDSPLRFFLDKVYKWNTLGPASVHKYRIGPAGPEKMGIFTHPEIFRMTIHKVFSHKGKKLLACTGFPNFIFIVDADSMEFIRKVTIKEMSGKESFVASLFPSPDGEKIYLVTTGSLQAVDVESGTVDLVYNPGRICDPFNHMTCVDDTDW